MQLDNSNINSNGHNEEESNEVTISPQLKINNLYGSDTEPSIPQKRIRKLIISRPKHDENDDRMTYHNVNIQMAIEFVLQRSKPIKEKIDSKELSDKFINDAIARNRTFLIAYNSFLQKLINGKQLTADFKNVQPKTFNKLEKFILDKMQNFHDMAKIQQDYHQKSKQISESFQKRIR